MKCILAMQLTLKGVEKGINHVLTYRNFKHSCDPQTNDMEINTVQDAKILLLVLQN